MKTQIENLLQEIESKYKITILYACESGSRAWGFPSPNSDYDVRFIYGHPRDWYLSLLEQKDSIQEMPSVLLDGSGWDLRKALRLLMKSNSSIFEWLQSPIVYRQNSNFVPAFKELIKDYFLPAKVMNHYLGIARGMLQSEFAGDKVKIKKYFYVLRAVLSAKWIGIYQTPPPIVFHDLLPLIDDATVLEAITNLLEEKETAKEGALIPRILVLDTFVANEMTQIEATIKNIARKTNTIEPLNQFFYQQFLKIQ